jgi:release factor glutamine methyltransferase
MSISVSTLALHRVAIVARLRAAGCVFAEDEADLLISSAVMPAELMAMVDRRIDGLPIEHILGWARFCGLRVAIAPGVFIPRRRTELLVRQAADLAGGPEPIVVDLCCGSGAVGAAVAASADQIRLYAADIDPIAVGCARHNLRPFGSRVYQGDLCTPLPIRLRGRVDVLVANVPYVPTDAMSLLPPEARLHEPRLALDGGADGLDVLRRVAAEAPAWLAPHGHVLVETSEKQAPTAAEILDRAGLTSHVVHSEDLDATVVTGSR